MTNENNSADGHVYVDLGLPSGTLWAECNVGASKPEDRGDYFAWGETQAKKPGNPITGNRTNTPPIKEMSLPNTVADPIMAMKATLTN